jgi:hypothetical protein
VRIRFGVIAKASNRIDQWVKFGSIVSRRRSGELLRGGMPRIQRKAADAV